MRITRQQVAVLIAHARATYPDECCGLIGVRDDRVAEIVPLTNTAASPRRYRLEPSVVLRILMDFERQALSLGAIYHSHPRDVAYPSRTDIDLALQPGCLHLILSLADPEQPKLRAFRIVAGNVGEVALAIED